MVSKVSTRRLATIMEVPTSDNGYFYVVVDEADEVHHLRGVGAPQQVKVWDTGHLVYRSSINRGWWVWEK